jgi:hypothetical protein
MDNLKHDKMFTNKNVRCRVRVISSMNARSYDPGPSLLPNDN